MTDRFKGLLVTFEKDIREEVVEKYIEAILLIKGVCKVESYVMGAQDHMMYRKGIIDYKQKIIDFMFKDDFEKTPS